MKIIVIVDHLVDTTVGKAYPAELIGTKYHFKDDVGDSRIWPTHQGWCEPLADTHEQETFGPLSDDPDVNPKKAAGAVKAPMHNLSPIATIQVENVLAGGEYKYGFMNYRESRIDARTYIGAIKRHFNKWQDGVDFDKESGQHELAHVMACCAILIDAHFTGKFIDNRSKTGLVEGMLKTSEETFGAYIAELSKS